MMNSVNRLWEKLRQEKLMRETVLYGIVGVATTVVSFAGYELFYALGMPASAASVFSSVVGIVFSFFPSKYIVFRSQTKGAAAFWKELGAFFSGRLVTLVGETVCLGILVDFLKFDKTLCKLVTTVMVIVANYFISKVAVFKKK